MLLPSMREPPRPEDFASPVHDRRVVARLGVWLGAAFVICFVTGLVSHLAQHPLPWLVVPPAPAWGYRVTQGVHVATGLGCVPLLLAKMYAAYPRLFERPLLGSPLRALERLSIGVLVASAFLQVVTGVFNIAQWYALGFGFTAVHWALAWVALGALAVHVAVKLPIIRTALAAPEDQVPEDQVPEDQAPKDQVPGDARSRRWFVRGALGVGAGAVLLSVGQAIPALEPLALLGKRRPSTSPQGVPINRTARQAGIPQLVDERSWAVVVSGPGGRRSLGYADLTAMEQTTVELPIACVEGWSVSARWSGVRVRDLSRLVGGSSGAFVVVESHERHGVYRRTTLPPGYADHPDTVLALTINGVRLTPDHGFPARIIAPNRPGVLQTKWVSSLRVFA